MAIALKVTIMMNWKKKLMPTEDLKKSLELALSTRLSLPVGVEVSSVTMSGNDYSAQLFELSNVSPDTAKSIMEITAKVIRERCVVEDGGVVRVTYGPLSLSL